MPIELSKFLKHFAFVLIGGVVSSAIAFLTNDPSVGAFVSAHPLLAFVVPTVAGALGSLAAWLNKQ